MCKTYTHTVGAKYCTRTYRVTDTVGKSMGTQENGKYKYANMRVVLELMHTTIGCGFIGNANMLISRDSELMLYYFLNYALFFYRIVL